MVCCLFHNRGQMLLFAFLTVSVLMLLHPCPSFFFLQMLNERIIGNVTLWTFYWRTLKGHFKTHSFLTHFSQHVCFSTIWPCGGLKPKLLIWCTCWNKNVKLLSEWKTVHGQKGWHFHSMRQMFGKTARSCSGWPGDVEWHCFYAELF